MVDCGLVADGDLLTDWALANTALDQCFAQKVPGSVSVGAGLARDGGVSAKECGDWHAAIVGKPAPTSALHCVSQIFSRKKTPRTSRGVIVVRQCG